MGPFLAALAVRFHFLALKRAAAAEVTAVVCICPRLIYQRVGFIFTNLSRPTERIFLTDAGRTTTRRDHR
jgi:hypothetical protein